MVQKSGYAVNQLIWKSTDPNNRAFSRVGWRSRKPFGCGSKLVITIPLAPEFWAIVSHCFMSRTGLEGFSKIPSSEDAGFWSFIKMVVGSPDTGHVLKDVLLVCKRCVEDFSDFQAVYLWVLNYRQSTRICCWLCSKWRSNFQVKVEPKNEWTSHVSNHEFPVVQSQGISVSMQPAVSLSSGWSHRKFEPRSRSPCCCFTIGDGHHSTDEQVGMTIFPHRSNTWPWHICFGGFPRKIWLAEHIDGCKYWRKQTSNTLDRGQQMMKRRCRPLKSPGSKRCGKEGFHLNKRPFSTILFPFHVSKRDCCPWKDTVLKKTVKGCILLSPFYRISNRI